MSPTVETRTSSLHPTPGRNAQIQLKTHWTRPPIVLQAQDPLSRFVVFDGSKAVSWKYDPDPQLTLSLSHISNLIFQKMGKTPSTMLLLKHAGMNTSLSTTSKTLGSTLIAQVHNYS